MSRSLQQAVETLFNRVGKLVELTESVNGANQFHSWRLPVGTEVKLIRIDPTSLRVVLGCKDVEGKYFRLDVCANVLLERR